MSSAHRQLLPLKANSVIGILGGGQLGRMTALAAARLGYRCHIFHPEAESPAAEVSAFATRAEWDDEAALAAFADSVDVVTLEFENVPAAALSFLEARVPVMPGASVLSITQHRVLEKDFVKAQGAETAPYRAVRSLEELRAAVAEIGSPCVLKTCRFGYDGKGQAKLWADSDLAAIWGSLKTDDAILEGFVNFTCEVSVIVARGRDGQVVSFPVVENRHANHILDETHVPAAIDPRVAEEARRVAAAVVAGFADFAGLLAIEMFVTADGHVLVNEMAPRPHNSGHWSMDGAVTDQFEQLVRAVSGHALGSTDILRPCVMKNLLGDDILKVPELMKKPGARVHLYGKSEAKPGRKMGHVNFMGIEGGAG
ncbi:5-(carboxyamino)imidazole ribonucleotide synthase [Radicibacter daui]|uniref:5-(carboxyamino)imidazole ribonucleotide synthase n=1 Tax=Radicibacter daui TaxID=3064829 RepID=UPI004046E95C